MTATTSANATIYTSFASTYQRTLPKAPGVEVCTVIMREMSSGIVDTRPWYRRWTFGPYKDGSVLFFGLGPLEVSFGRSW